MFNDTLTKLGARLGTKPHAEGELDAVIDGVPLEVRFVLRTKGSSSSKWTEIRVKSDHVKGFAFTLDLDVRPTESHEAQDVRDGRMRDVVIGDEAFDAAFIVEAAPEEVVRLMFDATARAELLALRPLRVLSTPSHAILIERFDWMTDVEALERLVRLAARLASALVPAARDAAIARRQKSLEPGYRGSAPTDDEIRAAWDLDVQRLAEQAAVRRARAQRNGLVFAALTFAALTSLAAFLATHC